MRRPRLPSGALAIGATLLLALALQIAGANPAVSQTTELVAWAAGDPGLDPDAAIWRDIPPLEVPLSGQAITYPTSTRGVPLVGARAILNRGVLYVRLDWKDATRDETTTRTESFSDAVALQLPGVAGTSVPAVCMGQADAGVNVWQWRADSQRGVPEVAQAFPDQYTDVGSTLGELAYPARVVGNPYAATGTGPVQDLVATGFGTLGPAPMQTVRGKGTWQEDGWAVVFARPLTAGGPGQPTLRLHEQVDLAFAVWNGSDGDRNGKKSVSQFVRLVLSNDVFPPIRVTQQNAPSVIWVLAVVPLIAFVLFGAAALLRTRRP